MGLIPFFRPMDLSHAALWAIEERLREGKLSNVNEHVAHFEELLSHHFQVKYAIACSSGSQALLLAVNYIKKRFAPATCAIPPFTDPSTFYALKMNGIQHIWRDIDPDTWTLEGTTIQEDMATPVNIFGQPPDPTQYTDIPIVYDAAHSIGVGLGGMDPACVSFAPSKLVTAVEGGAVLTNDEECARHVKALRDRVSRMSELHAAVGVACIRQLPFILDRRRNLAKVYQDSLPDVVFQKNEGNWSRISVLFSHPSLQHKALELAKGNIEFRSYYKPLKAGLDVCDDVASRVLQLPAWHNIESWQTEKVVDFLKSVLH